MSCLTSHERNLRTQSRGWKSGVSAICGALTPARIQKAELDISASRIRAPVSHIPTFKSFEMVLKGETIDRAPGARGGNNPY